jgi:pimeloyl-ACP methyl ester carboxylesterase
MMSSYVQLGEVHTYYEEDGSGEPLVLLHHGGAADWWRRCACSD